MPIVMSYYMLQQLDVAVVVAAVAADDVVVVTQLQVVKFSEEFAVVVTAVDVDGSVVAAGVAVVEEHHFAVAADVAEQLQLAELPPEQQLVDY